MNIHAQQQAMEIKGQISPAQTIYSFQQIPNTSPDVQVSSNERLDHVPEEKTLDIDENPIKNSNLDMKIEEEDNQFLPSTDRTDAPQNVSPPKEMEKPKFKYCDIVTFMLVDDFVFVLNAVQGMKLSMERKVEAFSKGTEAIESFKNHLNQGLLYHFLLIDFSMPVRFWDGYKLVEMIRNFEKEVDAPPAYIIGLDNDLDDDKLEDSQKRGFNSAIEKPLNPLKLTQIIQSRLNELGL